MSPSPSHKNTENVQLLALCRHNEEKFVNARRWYRTALWFYDRE